MYLLLELLKLTQLEIAREALMTNFKGNIPSKFSYHRTRYSS
jgi:hypothetical protein